MYIYDQYDQKIIDQRVDQFRDQTKRYLAGKIGEDEYRILRLQNGVYVQIHAPMLRVAIPYGLISSKQLRMLAHVAHTYDKDYGHITTRQNMQFNWPALEKVPDILAELATVQMHAIQTSGNCMRNVTSDHLAGISPDEIEDPRPYCEIIRQWSTLHPEFAYLPRKFKFAVSGAQHDRAATQIHDIGIQLVRNDSGEVGFKILVGGGLGRTPILAKVLNEFLPKPQLLSYLEAVLRVYNLEGRRDNAYKARIKILVQSLGIEAFREKVEAEWLAIKECASTDLTLDEREIERVKAFFDNKQYEEDATTFNLDEQCQSNSRFGRWVKQNTRVHKQAGYRAVFVSLKAPGCAPGDITTQQMLQVADLADRYSQGELRTTHDQNLVLADVKQGDLFALWQALGEQNLATANIGTLTDMICCPGLDFCSLANAQSLSVADQISDRFDKMDYLYDLGELRLKLSGCMNACGHHHVGHIGLLGVDKKGEQWYQITLGGSAENDAAIGKVIGRSVPIDEVADALEKILTVYVEQRLENEPFLETYRRIGKQAFKDKLYANH
ncbi:Sulfite reductase [NADPH] hemoprotein beta-component [hydrothermal vent metagenome]|uniref:Sulfite reductase [NADPH] hemoprotein beta-component n=1 Tax=hydrothermal vent metagenome TaxID=652676 RepID=A0A3B0YTU4_9ZZZZ